MNGSATCQLHLGRSLCLVLSLVATGCAPQVTERVVEGTVSEMPMVATLDLTAVADDRVPVTIDPGALTEAEVLFRLPRVVQGTYNVSDFGRFVEGLTAYDYDGAKLAVERLDSNTWRIADATRLNRLTYAVNDVERTGTPTPFSPAGTNIATDVLDLNEAFDRPTLTVRGDEIEVLLRLDWD